MGNFHLAFKVKDLDSTRKFYVDILGCKAGRSTSSWLDFDFFGNQLSAHVSDQLPALDYCGNVDGVHVPIPHFGALLDGATFLRVKERLEASEIEFIIKPQVRYEGVVGEQRTMFVFDYSNNPIEFKSYKNELEVFQE